MGESRCLGVTKHALRRDENGRGWRGPAQWRSRIGASATQDRSFHHDGSWARTISESKKYFCFVCVCLCVCLCLCLCFLASAPLAGGEAFLRRAQSQGKLWWKLAVILTSEPFVVLGERGERIIEPSSGWYPPQLPSGELELDSHQGKRMISGIGNVPCSTYSQTLHGVRSMGFFVEPLGHVMTLRGQKKVSRKLAMKEHRVRVLIELFEKITSYSIKKLSFSGLSVFTLSVAVSCSQADKFFLYLNSLYNCLVRQT